MLKTTINSQGKTIYYEANDFIETIVAGGHCFICGASKEEKKFNDEHILPNWILTYFRLHDQSITLPNGAKHKYSKYKIPCCQECNTFLGNNMEIPLSAILKLSYNEVMTEFSENEELRKLLFRWCAMVFFKEHLKDMKHCWHLNRTMGEDKIGQIYDWYEFHHIHCVVRSLYTNAEIADDVFGTLLVLPAVPDEDRSANFDFATNSEGLSLLIRLNDFAIIAILNDSSFSKHIFGGNLAKLNYPLDSLQLREVFSHLTYININLQPRPTYMSLYNKELERYIIAANLPVSWELKPIDQEEITFGDIFIEYCLPWVGKFPSKEKEQEITELMRQGTYTFLTGIVE